MTIQATCRCGASFKAAPKLAGKRIKCPACDRPFIVPRPATGTSIRARCPCGQTFAAKAALAGKQVRCPKCGGTFAVTAPRAPGTEQVDSAGLPVPQFDPLVPSASSDPLGLAGLDQLAALAGPAAQPQPTFQAPALRQPPPAAPTQMPRRPKQRRVGSDSSYSPLEIAAGIAAIYHGGSAVYRAILVLGAYAAISTLTGPSDIFSFTTIILGVGWLISGGILAGGIGIFTRIEALRRIGVHPSFAWFALFALGLIGTVISWLSSKSGTAVMQFYLWSLPRILLDGLAPTLLITLENRR